MEWDHFNYLTRFGCVPQWLEALMFWSSVDIPNGITNRHLLERRERKWEKARKSGPTRSRQRNHRTDRALIVVERKWSQSIGHCEEQRMCCWQSVGWNRFSVSTSHDMAQPVRFWSRLKREWHKKGWNGKMKPKKIHESWN